MFVSVVLLSGNVRIGVAYIISNSATEDYAFIHSLNGFIDPPILGSPHSINYVSVGWQSVATPGYIFAGVCRSQI